MPPTLTDRIATQLMKAAVTRLQSSSMRLDKRGNITSAPLQAAISQLAFQVAKQGLSPTDFDRPDGIDALHAIVAAIPPKQTEAVVSFLPLPDEWKHVVNAAYRQADHLMQQVRK